MATARKKNDVPVVGQEQTQFQEESVRSPAPECAEPTLKMPQRARERAVQILARSLFARLRTEGYDLAQVLQLSSALIGLANYDISRSRSASETPTNEWPQGLAKQP